MKTSLRNMDHEERCGLRPVALLPLALAKVAENVSRLITHRYPREEFAKALARPTSDEIKAVVEWR
ncbi:MAG: hypothetical protein M3041_19645 [Acidobacteriota bacterium]|nr:hypothetical protein [Acidobacteriota bacterium]